MISIIMPTMWIGPYYEEMINAFNDHPLVGEIIIIDNDTELTDINLIALSKVKHIPQKENVYVNPAWNLGASLAKYDKLCFYSDDVKLNVSVLDKIYDFIIPSNGLIGIQSDCVWETSNQLDNDISKVSVESTKTPNRFYAVCFFVHKNNYYDIPEELKIYYGDTYLFYKNKHEGRDNLQICNTKILTLLSTTSSVQDFSSIISTEKTIARKYLDPLSFDMDL